MIQYLHAQNSFALTANANLVLQIHDDGTIGTGSSSGTLVIKGGATYPGGQIALAGGVGVLIQEQLHFLRMMDQIHPQQNVCVLIVMEM